MHAGEADGAQSVRDAVEVLRAERIGHGIRALEDPGTVEMLAERRIPLEICPTSNRLTGVALAGRPHPLRRFRWLGCIVTIDCDDPAIFRTSLAAGVRGWSSGLRGAAALERYVRNAIHASFADARAKQAMEAQLAAALTELQRRREVRDEICPDTHTRTLPSPSKCI